MSRFLSAERYRLDPDRAARLVGPIAMHELGLMESALATVLAAARTRGARHVHRITLRVGSLSGAEPDALRFAFEAIARGTPAEGASLDIDTVPARARCGDCGVEFAAGSGFVTECPRCRRFCGELRQGRELELTRFEMS